jgi:hypothetical protein
MSNSLYVWDVDDVLNNLTKDFISYIAPSIPYKEILNPNIHDSLGLSQNDYHYELDNFRRREYLNLKPNLEITDFIKSRKGSMHYILTSVPHEFIEISFCWVKRNFDKTFFGYLFAPSRREDINLQTPAKMDHLNNSSLTIIRITLLMLIILVLLKYYGRSPGTVLLNRWKKERNTLKNYLKRIETKFKRNH